MHKRYQSGEHSIGTQENIRAITCHIASEAQTVLDIGSNEGLVACALDNLGYTVHAYEENKKTAVFAQEFIARNKQHSISYCNQLFEIDNLDDVKTIDVALLLSVHHQVVKNRGWEYANQLLCNLYKKVRFQLFFQPALIQPKYGTDIPFIENDISSCFAYFLGILQTSDVPIHGQIINITHNFMPPQEQFRPLFLFSKTESTTRRNIPSVMDYVANPEAQKPHLVFVDVNQSIAPMGLQSFAPENWHYLVAASREIIAGVRDEDSILHRYYKQIQPHTMGEVFSLAGFSTEIGALKNWEIILTGMPLLCQSKSEVKTTPIPKKNRHAFGPMEGKYISYQISILRHLIKSITTQGYCPELHIDGHICGTIIRRGDECRFWVFSGQHRLAVLSALGYKNFVAKFHPYFMPYLNYKDVKNWPVVKNGYYTPPEAQYVFDAFFDSNGTWCSQIMNPLVTQGF